MKINFINHACFQIFINDYSLLVDPWFFGKVFNNSWSLLRETNASNLDLSNLKYILVSHEHPDHLNFDTLKSIYNINSKVQFIFPYRDDPTVKKVIEKIGFNFHFIKQNSEKYMLDEKNTVKYFSNDFEGDHTIVFSIDDKVIVNQNDDYTDEKSISIINKEYKKVDILFTQFSLAGYYGNSDDSKSIKKNGHDFHLERVLNYKSKFNAPIVVPFASYVYFCKKTNMYLNNFKVMPNEVYELLGSKTCQLVYFGDEVFFESNQYQNRNIRNLSKLNELFNFENLSFDDTKKIDFKDLTKIIDTKLSEMNFSKKIKAFTNNYNLKNIIRGCYKYYLLCKPIIIKVTDSENFIQIDFIKNKSRVLSSKKEKQIYDFSIPSEELYYMFKFPWGSDTANITATVNYYSKRSFYFFEYLLRYYHVHGAKFF